MAEDVVAPRRGFRDFLAAGGLGWTVLALLLLATLVAAVRFDRAGRPSLVGDEATYAMQAASLAWDFDLAYERKDYDRFVASWGGPPDGLILQSGDGGARITFGKPPLYALAIAPFVRFAPVRGGVVANALMLAVAAVLAARALRLRVGNAAPLWVAVFAFASVAFAYVFWVHADLFLMAATVSGFALAYGGGGDRPRGAPLAQIYDGEMYTPGRRVFLRWLAAGLLITVAGAIRPFYLALLLPALLAARGDDDGRRRARIAGLAAGALCLLLVTSLAQWGAGGHWSGYGGERQGFYPRTGYPDVDFPSSEWSDSVRRWGNTSWLQEGAYESRLSARLLGWDTAYFLAGRNVGVLPYFLPLLLAFAAYRGERGRWAIVLAVALAVLGLFLVRPFNFYGGGGAIGNRYFLPLYGALWFVAAKPVRAFWGGAVTVLAALFLYPLWLHPAAFPIGEDGRYRHVSEFAQRFLPYETTQSHIPGGQDVSENGFWVKLLNHNVWRSEGREGLRLIGNADGDLLLGSPTPVDRIVVELDSSAPSRLEVGGKELRPVLFKPDGSLGFDVDLGRPRAVHPMWWTWDDYYLYELRLRLPNAPVTPVSFRIFPSSAPDVNLIQKSRR